LAPFLKLISLHPDKKELFQKGWWLQVIMMAEKILK